MSGYTRINGLYDCCIKLLSTNLRLSRLYSDNASKSRPYVIDVLDDFTSQLIQRNTNKWETQKTITKQKILRDTVLNKPRDCSEIRNINAGNINLLFQNAIDIEDNSTIINLAKQCIECKICPNLNILIHILSICSLNGDKDTIVKITQMCEDLRPEILERNSNFQHYLAEAIWIKGNITNSLKLFEEVYEENPFLRRRIRLMLRYLILDVVTNRSEAALLNIIKFSEKLVQNHQDFYPLTYIWQSCFLSEWFTDQCIALELLKKNDGLCKSVVNRIPYVVSISLRSHSTEVVYRLLEILLKYNMKMEYTGVLLALLDYQIRQGDNRRCSEIIQWAVKNEVNLPTIHRENFLNLLLKDNMNIPRQKDKCSRKSNTNFKF